MGDSRLTVAGLLAFAGLAGVGTRTVAQDSLGRPVPSEPQLMFHEVSRESKGKFTAIDYDLRSSGFPQGTVFDLWFKAGAEDAPVLLFVGFVADSAGELICGDQKTLGRTKARAPWCVGPLRGVLIGAGRLITAEPVQAHLVSQDERIRVNAHTIPFPVEASDAACRIWAEVTTKKAEVFLLHGEGFEPNASVETALRVVGATVIDTTGTSQATVDGQFTVLVGKPPKGGDGGTTTFSATSTKCRVSIDYEWGKPGRRLR